MEEEAKEMREKYWSELTDEEKIERLREQVRMLIARAQNSADIISKLQRHDHLDNEIVIKLGTHEMGGSFRGRPQEDDDVYF